jgi:type II secretion system protein H
MKISTRQQGFTLLEVLLIIGLFGLMVALAIPFYQSFQVSSELDNSTHEIISTLRQAQMKAMASEGWQPCGLHFDANAYTLFEGKEYDEKNPANQRTELPGVLSIKSDNQDVIFSRIQGVPNVTGEITVLSSNRGTRVITINELGAINAQ